MPPVPAALPPDPPPPPAALAPPGAGRARLLRAGQRALASLRVACALGVVLGWVGLALPGASRAWLQAARTPANTGISFDAQRAPPGDGTLYPLLIAAHDSCPATQPLLVLSDDERAWQRGNYFLYPQQLDVVLSTDPLDAARLAAYAGGCVFYYGPQGTRLDPFRDRLTPLTCTADGCLLRIGK